VTGMRPAYSQVFDDDHLVGVAPLHPVRELTSDWAWGGSRGAGVKVAVLDSGIDQTHPAVGPIDGYLAISTGPDGKLVYDSEPHEDRAGHGTACAGVIRSLAPDCELYSIKVLGAAAAGTGEVFMAGLRWAIENGIHVCNLSLGTTKREYFAKFHDLVDRAYFRNTVLVTAANNMPMTSFPSLYSSVISVASHANQDPYTFYYNPSPPVEFGALGIGVRVAWRNHKFTTMTGNSFAAPHMTGLVTGILAKHPGLTIFQLKTILRELAANVDRGGVSESPHLLGQTPPREEGAV
jgi:subtilisin